MPHKFKAKRRPYKRKAWKETMKRKRIGTATVYMGKKAA